MSTAGPYKNVSINNRLFTCSADTTPQETPGGRQLEFMPNSDQSTGRVKVNVVGWKVTSVSIIYNDDNEDLEYIQDLCDSNALADLTFTDMDNVTKGASGYITGEVVGNRDTMTIPLTFEGPGKLEQQ